MKKKKLSQDKTQILIVEIPKSFYFFYHARHKIEKITCDISFLVATRTRYQFYNFFFQIKKVV